MGLREAEVAVAVLAAVAVEAAVLAAEAVRAVRVADSRATSRWNPTMRKRTSRSRASRA